MIANSGEPNTIVIRKPVVRGTRNGIISATLT